MQKAIKWLNANNIPYTFHDYKEAGIDKATINNWLQYLPLDKVVNKNSTTYKELPEEDRAAISSKPKAIALMMKHNSVIKRPLWDFGDNTFLLGWNEPELAKKLLLS